MSFFDELKRRNVIRVGIAYTVAAWLLTQVVQVAAESFEAPVWVMKMLISLLIIGLPITLFFSWAYEITPEGIRKEADIKPDSSITHETAKKLDYMTMALLAAVVGFLALDRFVLDRPVSGSVRHEAVQLAEGAPESTVDENSIAVLPFANRSNQADDLFFTDGIHDDLLTQLAKISDLKVISRTSVMKYKNTQLSIPEIARELDVSTILEGGVQRAGQRIRINAQLIDVATDKHLWAETFDREMTIENLFDIQSEITRQIVTAVRGELTDAEQQALGNAPTDNLEALEAYMRARAATNRADYAQQKYIEAEPWAQRAVSLDPDFADAWALLSEIHGQAVWIGYDRSPERFEAAKFARDRAVSLNPGSATVKAAQADYLYRFENDYPAALIAYREALSIAPGDSRIMMFKAITLRRLGRWDESMRTFEKALELDPANVFIVTLMADTLAYMNEWGRVEEVVKKWTISYPDSGDLKAQQIQAMIFLRGNIKAARELFKFLPPWVGWMYNRTANLVFRYDRDYDGWIAILNQPEIVEFNSGDGERSLIFAKGEAHYFAGNPELAKQYFQSTVDEILTNPQIAKVGQPWDHSILAMVYAYVGDPDKALEESNKAIAMLPVERDHLFGPIFEKNHALVLALTGHRDEALAILEEHLDTPRGYVRWALYLDPAWDFFRDDERFNELARPLNLDEARR